MKVRRRSNLLIDPPSSATGDIAFNLIVFFLVCASVQPDSGRKQTIPQSEQVKEEKQKTENIEVRITRIALVVNGDPLRLDQLESSVKAKLSGKTRPEDKVVIVKSDKDTPYNRWIEVTSRIEDVGGIVTLQLEEEREVAVP
jgi:biopolymer transport protein ExbD